MAGYPLQLTTIWQVGPTIFTEHNGWRVAYSENKTYTDTICINQASGNSNVLYGKLNRYGQRIICVPAAYPQCTYVKADTTVYQKRIICQSRAEEQRFYMQVNNI